MNRKAIIAVVALLIANNSVRANDTDGVVLRYGETIRAGYGSGNQILTPYVTFPSDRIKAFADRGCSVSAVRIGLAKAATNVTVYLKHHATDRRPFYSQKVGSLKAGWNTIQLTSPQVLTAEPLCVGYKATFAEAGGAAYDGYVSTQADTVLVNTSSKWATIDGSFCIQPIVSGDNLPENYVIVDPLPMDTYTYDSVPAMRCLVRNVGTNRVESVEYSISNDNGNQQTVTTAASLDVNATDTLDLRIAANGVFSATSPLATTIGMNDYSLMVSTVNADASGANKDAEEVTAFHFERRDPRYMRRIVMEDFTGSWCQFCVAGIEELRYMKNGYEHPEESIPISIHVPTDQLALADNEYSYAPLLNKCQGFPTVFSNRMDDYTMTQPYGMVRRVARAIQAVAGTIGLEGKAQFNADSTAIDVTTALVSAEDIASPEYNISFVLLEDSIDGQQYNGYAGGSSGSFLGWENLPQFVNIKYDDVARGVYNSFSGKPYTANAIAAGEAVPYSYSMDLTKCPVSDKRNLHVVALLLNTDGSIVNAVNIYPTAGSATAIHQIVAKESSPAGPLQVYTADGHQVGTFTSRSALMGSSLKGLLIVKTANNVSKIIK